MSLENGQVGVFAYFYRAYSLVYAQLFCRIDGDKGERLFIGQVALSLCFGRLVVQMSDQFFRVGVDGCYDTISGQNGCIIGC